MKWKLKTPAENDPLALDSALVQANLAGYDGCAPYDAIYVQALIKRATNIVEEETNRQLVTATWAVFFDAFPYGRRTLEIWGRLPGQSVTEIRYIDQDGAAQTVDLATLEIDMVDVDVPPRIRPKEGNVWPEAGHYLNAIEIDMVAGYGDGPEDMPPKVTHALAGMVSEMWNLRESVSMGTIAKIPGNAIDRALALLEWGRYPC